MAKKFHVDASSKGIIRAGVNPKGLQKWKTSEDPRAIRQGVSKSKGVEIAPEAKAKPRKQKTEKEQKASPFQKNSRSSYFSGRF